MKMKGKMKGIYLESRYTLFISLIYFYKIKNDIEERKSVELK